MILSCTIGLFYSIPLLFQFLNLVFNRGIKGLELHSDFLLVALFRGVWLGTFFFILTFDDHLNNPSLFSDGPLWNHVSIMRVHGLQQICDLVVRYGSIFLVNTGFIRRLDIVSFQIFFRFTSRFGHFLVEMSVPLYHFDDLSVSRFVENGEVLNYSLLFGGLHVDLIEICFDLHSLFDVLFSRCDKLLVLILELGLSSLSFSFEIWGEVSIFSWILKIVVT